MTTRRQMSNRICAIVVCALLMGSAACRSLDHGPAIDLSGDGVQGSPVVTAKDGQTLIYNFRAVEPGVLYRGSDFNRARPEGAAQQPLAFQDGQLFEFLRSLNIHHVVSLLPPPEFYAEEGYFKYWAEHSGYVITASSLPVAADQVYEKNDRSAVHAAAELLAVMKDRRREDGAVLIHGEAGKDAIGVMAAAYELARASRNDDPAVWNNIVRRFLASNTLAAPSSPSVTLTAGSLERIRPELKFVAQLF